MYYPLFSERFQNISQSSNKLGLETLPIKPSLKGHTDKPNQNSSNRLKVQMKSCPKDQCMVWQRIFVSENNFCPASNLSRSEAASQQ